MQFNTEKCTVMHIGTSRHNCISNINDDKDGNESSDEKCKFYKLNDVSLKCCHKEKDLGIIVDSSFKFREQCNSAVNSAYCTLGMIKRTINFKNKDVVVKLYKALVRPKLEYCIQAWRPYFKKDIEKLEQVQHRATKMITGFYNKTYDERLCLTGLTTLEDRRDRGDSIEVFKYLKGFNVVNYRKYFKLSGSFRTRGHSLKLEKSRCRLDVRKHFFSQRVVNGWNGLSEEVVAAQSVNVFKNRFDRFVMEKK